MQAVFLKIYVQENRRHQGKLLFDWLLQEANRMGLTGGSAFRALAGFGRHHRLHEAHFFELAGDLPVEVGFVAQAADADKFLAHIAAQGLDLFYVRLPAECGSTGQS